MREYTQKQWYTAAERLCVVLDANGFDRPSFETLPTKLMFVVTELEEAQQAVCGEGEDPLNEELADTAVRLMHILQNIRPKGWHLRDQGVAAPRCTPFCRIEQLLWPILSRCCKAVECWRKNWEIDTLINLEFALSATVAVSTALGYDLMADVVAKTEKNAERGHLHGKVRSAG